MARFQLDFTKVEDRSFPIYPPGAYILQIAETKQEAAKSSGELKLTVMFEIVSGPAGGNEFAGKKVISSYSLQQQAAFRLVKLLGAVGIPTEQMTSVDDQELLGRQVQATLSVETWQGRQLNRVGDEQPVNGLAAPAAPQQPAQPAPSGFAAPQQMAAPPAPAVPPQQAMPHAPPPQQVAAQPGMPQQPVGPAAAPPPAQPQNWGQAQPQPGQIPAGFQGTAPPPPPKPVQ